MTSTLSALDDDTPPEGEDQAQWKILMCDNTGHAIPSGVPPELRRNGAATVSRDL